MATPWERVSKQMVQMFGPTWVEKFGKTNDAWESALKGLEYAQISAGLSKVRNGALKFYELDLPRFLELCKPPPAPRASFQIDPPEYMKNMCQDEMRMMQMANMKMMVFCYRHPKYGVNGAQEFSDEQILTLHRETIRLTHDFFLMREELGKEAVPDEEFITALQLRWSKIAGT
jgi:hypothetical protein